MSEHLPPGEADEGRPLSSEHSSPAGEHPLSGHEHPLSGHEHPLSGDGHPLSGDEHPLSADGHPLSADEHPLSADEHPLSADEHPLSADEHPLSAETKLIHAGTQRLPGSPAAPPLVPASVYASWGEPDPPRAYGRNGNPSWEALEQALGVIEDAEAVVFASGQAASMALMLAVAKGRQQVVLPTDGYYNTRMLADWLRPHGAAPVAADLLDLAQVEHHLVAGPSVLWAETPTNPLLRVADLAGLARLASAADAPMVVDNTVATGLLQKPLDLGAVASMCSLTKSASGHSDVLLGAVMTRDHQLAEDLRGWRAVGGGIPGPFESWLVLRGLKTLNLRIARQSENALTVAQHLAGHQAGSFGSLSRHRHRVCGARGGEAADAARLRPAAFVRGGRDRRGRRRGGAGLAGDPPGHELRRGRVGLGTTRPMGIGDRPRVPHPLVGRDRAGGRPHRRHRPEPRRRRLRQLLGRGHDPLVHELAWRAASG